jgi:hypothetical protein
MKTKSFLAACIVYLQFKHNIMSKNREKVAKTRPFNYTVHASKHVLWLHSQVPM